MSLLEVRSLRAGYASSTILHEVSFSVDEGDHLVVLGANGAGKSTLLRALTGLCDIHEGAVLWRGADISRWPTHRIVNQGLGHVPEGRQIFPELTVDENLSCGAHNVSAAEARNEMVAIKERLPILERLEKRAAGHLSGGEQQILAIARALVGRPHLLLLDEPTLGLAPQTVDAIYSLMADLHSEGLTIISVEQAAHRAMQMASRVLLLDSGEVVFNEPADAALSHEDIARIYLGA